MYHSNLKTEPKEGLNEHLKLIVEYAGKLRRDTPNYDIVEFGYLVNGTLEEVKKASREEGYKQGFEDGRKSEVEKCKCGEPSHNPMPSTEPNELKTWKEKANEILSGIATEHSSVALAIKLLIAQEKKASREEVKNEMEYQLRQIAEIYIGMDGFTPVTAPEAYQQMKLKEMYDEIQKLLAPKGE